MTSIFPPSFFWGASTSSHQVEGGNFNDWSEWEKKNATRLAAKSAAEFSHLSVWSSVRARAEDPANYLSDRACDHWHRFEEDFDIAKSLGLNALRLSLEWSRIEPREGEFDERALRHYQKMLHAMRKRGLEPFVTLWHWTLPLWLTAQGGWDNPKVVPAFCRYAQKIATFLKDDVRFWITLNEPEIYASHGYYLAIWPPQKKGLMRYRRVFRTLARAHVAAYRVIKQISPEAQVSLAKNNTYFDTLSKNPVNIFLKYAAHWWVNEHFLNWIAPHFDFIGLNYYTHNRIRWGFNKNENVVVSDLGWEVFPEGLYHLLLALRRFHRPIYITEHGIADSRDVMRARYIRDSLDCVGRAMREGVDVRGYLHWSLLDNFEWDKGFWPRFGLVAVDFASEKLSRRVRASAREYSSLIKTFHDVVPLKP